MNDIQKKHLESPGFNKQALEKLLRNRIFQSAFDELKDDPERGLKFLAAYFSASKSERKIMCMSINGVGGNDEEAVRFPKLAKALQVDTSNTKDVPWTAGIFTSLYQLIYLGRSEYGAHIAGICVGSGVVIAAVVSLGAISPYLSVIGGASASIGIPGLLSENCSFWEEVGFPQFVTLTGPLETVFPSPEGAAVVTAINIITDVVLPTLITTMQVLTVGGVRNTQQLIMWVIYSLSHFGGLAEGLEDEAYSDGNSDLGSCFEDDLTDLPEVFERLYLTDNPDENDPANGIQVEIDIEPPVSHGANSEVTELGENVGNMSIEDVF